MDQDEAGRRIAELEDELKRRDRRIEELKADLDESRALVHRMSEHVEDRSGIIDAWIEGFEMVLSDDGEWTTSPFLKYHDEIVDKYGKLLRKWNKFVPEYNAAILKRNVGRPLAASEAQQADVLKRHKRGESLRSIADDMSLGLRTVRTIVDRADGVDRTTAKHLARIKPEDMAAWKSRKRTRDALPRRVNALLKDKADLLKEAKGLGG
jgi:hypothetical protein